MENEPYVHRGIKLPEHIKESLDAYVQTGRPTGDFLRACIDNNLREACGRADEENLGVLAVIVAYLYNRCPTECWGSRGSYDAWLVAHSETRAIRSYLEYKDRTNKEPDERTH